MSFIKLEESWKHALADEFSKPYFAELKTKLLQEKKSGVVVYPPGPKIFAALDQTPLHSVKVVLLGQDPYHGPDQAHGLCFSVNDGIAFPPSLQNIFKELEKDIVGFKTPASGNLSKWAAQGVLLLNASLTVRANQANSHSSWGWQTFTDKIIQTVSQHQNHVVFLLWGNYAQSKIPLIDTGKHLVLKTVHPSPLSASRGFFGCRHFSKANQFLLEKGMEEVDWKL